MENKLLTIINQVLTNAGKPAAAHIEQQTSLRNDLGFDSFHLAELTVRIEDAYGIDVFENGIVNTIGEIEAILSVDGK